MLVDRGAHLAQRQAQLRLALPPDREPGRRQGHRRQDRHQRHDHHQLGERESHVVRGP